MPDVEQLLHKAVPRLRKADPKAAKLRARLIKLAAVLWSRGPSRLQKLGVVVGDDDWESVRPQASDRFLVGAHGVLGDRDFVRFLRAVKQELAERVKKKKESQRLEVAAPKPKPKPKPKPRSESKGLDFSDEGEVADGSGSGSDELSIPNLDDLAVPDDSDELAIPDAEPMVEIAPAIEVEEFDFAAVDEAPLQVRMDGASGGGHDASAASAGERALSRYRKTGDREELKGALKRFKEAYKEAEHPFPKGVALAGLAHAYLLAGDRKKAQDHAKKALQKFPNEPTAVMVLCRVGRKGEKARIQVESAMRKVEASLVDKDLRGVREAAEALKKYSPDGPEGPLAELAAAVAFGRDDLEDLLAKAWRHYPGPVTNGDLPYGKAWEDPLIKGTAAWLLRQRDADEEATLKQAVENTGAPDNLVAGAIELLLGTARRALGTREQVAKHEQQDLLAAVGRALFLAQHYDAAKEMLGAARRVDRNGPNMLDISRMEQQCDVMRRAFDKPGVKARRGKLEGKGLPHFRQSLAERLELVLTQRAAEAGDVEERQAQLVESLVGDPKRRAKLVKRAKADDLDDPFLRLSQVEAQQADLTTPDAEPEPAAETGGGFFGKMKAGLGKAAAKAKSAAKGAELAVRRSMAAGKRKEALRAVGQALRDRPEGGWADKELDAFLDETDAVSAKLEFLDEEAGALRKIVARVGDL